MDSKLMERPTPERMPQQELDLRHAQCRKYLELFAPQAEGLLAFSRVNIYYLTGHMGNGLIWLPKEGEPVLLVRRGLDRARLESPLQAMGSFRSYGDVPQALADLGSPLGKTVAAEMSGLPWSLANLLQAKLPGVNFVSGDQAIMRSRAMKTQWELVKMRLAGARHHKSLHDLLPQHIRPGMSEREISLAAWDVFYSQGHTGHMRMNNFGDEIFLGHVAAGVSANYPSVFNGPVGLLGEHPAIPFMGYAGVIWQENQLLTCDIGFSLEGYVTDKTQVYWSGPSSTLPDEARRAHDFCMEMQQWLADNAKPGALPSELYAHCMAESEKRGWTEGFMALEPNKVVFLGHGIGLTIDEFPPLAKGFDEPLEAGMALALEPKHGIAGLGMVGCENTFEVTDQGAKCLTGNEFEIVCLGD